jgi:5-methylcytosine-specific restriction endonuclease McrA
MTYKEKLKDPRWQKKRLKIFERDGWKCTECGRTELTLEVHHLSYSFSEPWNEPDENLQTLCFKCHIIVGLCLDFTEVKQSIRDRLKES